MSSVGGAVTAIAGNANINVADLVTAPGSGDVSISSGMSGAQGGSRKIFACGLGGSTFPSS